VNINPQEDEGYEVPIDWCNRLPAPENQLVLGHFESCLEAIKKARALDISAVGWYVCCK